MNWSSCLCNVVICAIGKTKTRHSIQDKIETATKSHENEAFFGVGWPSLCCDDDDDEGCCIFSYAIGAAVGMNYRSCGAKKP